MMLINLSYDPEVTLKEWNNVDNFRLPIAPNIGTEKTTYAEAHSFLA